MNRTYPLKPVIKDQLSEINGQLMHQGELIHIWKEKHIEPVCSKAIIDKYLRVLAYPKFQITGIEIDFLLTVEILPWFRPVAVPEGKPYIKHDPQGDILSGAP